MPDITSRELVHRALRFEPAPRLPRQMWTLIWALQNYGDQVNAVWQEFPDDVRGPDQVILPPVDCVRGDPHGVGSNIDEWGSQNALLIDPELWRELYKPLYAEYVRRIHAAGKFAFMHTDGYVFDILEDLIEIGVDAINSQLFCMDIEEIGRRFKGRITFWGEIDQQQILPYGTIEETRQAVRRVANALYDGNGGVIAQCWFGMNAKYENVRAVFDEWNIISEASQPGVDR